MWLIVIMIYTEWHNSKNKPKLIQTTSKKLNAAFITPLYNTDNQMNRYIHHSQRNSLYPNPHIITQLNYFNKLLNGFILPITTSAILPIPYSINSQLLDFQNDSIFLVCLSCSTKNFL